MHVPTRMIPAWKKLTGYQDITSQKYGMGRALGKGKKRVSQQKWKDAHEAFLESVTQDEYLRRVYAFASPDIKAVNAHKKQFVKDCVAALSSSTSTSSSTSSSDDSSSSSSSSDESDESDSEASPPRKKRRKKRRRRRKRKKKSKCRKKKKKTHKRPPKVNTAI